MKNRRVFISVIYCLLGDELEKSRAKKSIWFILSFKKNETIGG